MIFTTKVVRCQTYKDVVDSISSLEEQWVWALLSRFNIPQDILDRAKNDPSYPKYEWRDYLIFNYGLQIEKDFGAKKTIVKRTNLKKGDTIIVGEWSEPEVIQVKTKSDRTYEIHLKYFNLI
jgi:hypothetical protein